MTTVHANSSKDSLGRLEMLVAEKSVSPMQRFIAMSVNMILYIQRLGQRGPVLTEILEVNGYDSVKGEYEVRWIKQREQSDGILDLDE